MIMKVFFLLKMSGISHKESYGSIVVSVLMQTPQQVCADGRHLHQFYVWNGNDAMVPSQFQLNFLPAASLSLATSWLLAECLFFQSDRYHFGEVG